MFATRARATTGLRRMRHWPKPGLLARLLLVFVAPALLMAVAAAVAAVAAAVSVGSVIMAHYGSVLRESGF